jgi:hypothetical protein
MSRRYAEGFAAIRDHLRMEAHPPVDQILVYRIEDLLDALDPHEVAHLQAKIDGRCRAPDRKPPGVHGKWRFAAHRLNGIVKPA